MVDGAGDLRLALEALDHLWVVQMIGAQDLQRDLPPDAGCIAANTSPICPNPVSPSTYFPAKIRSGISSVPSRAQKFPLQRLPCRRSGSRAQLAAGHRRWLNTRSSWGPGWICGVDRFPPRLFLGTDSRRGSLLRKISSLSARVGISVCGRTTVGASGSVKGGLVPSLGPIV